MPHVPVNEGAIAVFAPANLRDLADQATKAWDDLIEPDFVFVDDADAASIVFQGGTEPETSSSGVIITSDADGDMLVKVVLEANDHARIDATIGVGFALGLSKSDDPTSIMFGGTEVERPSADDIAAAQAIHGADSGDNLLFGHSTANLLFGGDGGDFVFAAGGSDTIGGGNGSDLLFGGTGDDVLYGAAGDDTIFAGDGDDVIFLGAGANVVYAGLGEDTIYGADEDDVIYADPLIA